MKCPFCDYELRYNSCWDSHNDFYSQFICKNHISIVKFDYIDGLEYTLECIKYRLNNYVYKCDWYLNSTTIYLIDSLSFRESSLFKSDSIIIISPEDLERKIPILTTLV